MAIDITQFRQVFFEESLEGLEAMESSLLQLEEGTPAEETINTIFRAAHTIKGGGGTFGFQELTSFTHVLENLLDEMRSGRRLVTQEAVSLLLQAVDVLRGMLAALQAGTEIDQPRVTEIQTQLEALWHGPAEVIPHPSATLKTAGDPVRSPASEGWHIAFHPCPTMLQTGNDPLRLFRELETLGTLTVRVDMTRLPAFADLAPETCYLSWELTLHGAVSREQVSAVFEWVEGDCALSLTPLSVPQAAGDVPSLPSPEPAAVVERRIGVDRRAGVERRQPTAAADTNSIRVNIAKIDALINTVGELVITQAMLSQLRDGFDMRHLDKLRDGLDQLERNTRELQESVMSIRMLPISFAFNRFPRLVHDLGQQLGKKVQLTISGEQTELDKTVMEKIGDPLLHLVRNALDHGIEPPARRSEAGKPETGCLHLHAYHQGGTIVIEVSDNGTGLNRDKILRKAREQGLVGEDETPSDEQVYALIFQAGFSTAETISEISGRGVGMDVVWSNIKDLGGTIAVFSEGGNGTTFTIRLPLTLAILDGQLVRVGRETYIVPLIAIVESVQIDTTLIHTVVGQSTLYKLRDDYIPIVRLGDLFCVQRDGGAGSEDLLMVVESAGRKIGLIVDELHGQQQVVIKSLETNFRRIEGVSGATILGDGTVALILDIAGLLRLAQYRGGMSIELQRTETARYAA
jgi:two-component system, chemotaxis family, sensor kinase CheA